MAVREAGEACLGKLGLGALGGGSATLVGSASPCRVTLVEPTARSGPLSFPATLLLLDAFPTGLGAWSRLDPEGAELTLPWGCRRVTDAWGGWR